MGWTASYQVLRDHALSSEELAQIAELVRRQRKLPWDSETFHVGVATQARADRVVAAGMTKMAMDTESGDSSQLANAITELARLIPGGDVRVVDDFDTFGWDPVRGCVLGGRTASSPLVDVASHELTDPTALIPSPAVAIDPKQDVGALLALLGGLDSYEQKQPVATLLATRDPREVAVAIYERYGSLGRDDTARSVLDRALDRVEDPATLAGPFLTAWRQPSGTYFYGDMPLPGRFRTAIASVPEAIDQFIADVAATETAGDEDIPWRCAEVAVDLLARGGDRGQRALLEVVRRYRGKQLPWRMQLYVVDPAHRALAAHGDARVIPTLLFYLGTMTCLHHAHHDALVTLVRIAPDRVRPHVLALAAGGMFGDTVVQLLVALGGVDTIEPLRRLAQHPHADTRTIAGNGLRALGEEPPAYVERPLEDRAVDVDRTSRRDALRELVDRKDKSTFTSLVLAEALDKALRDRIGDPALSFSWWDWKGIVPDAILQEPTGQKLAWAASRGGRSMLGRQILWPSVAKIPKVGVAAIESTYPPSLLAFDAATLAALAAEEKP